MTREVVAVFSDLHAGSTLGLMAPEGIDTDDGNHVGPNKVQAWLWGKWLLYRDAVREARKKASLTLLIDGDMLDGDHHQTHQLVSPNPSDQYNILRAVLEPMLALSPERIIVVRGTEAHVGPSGTEEEAAAKALHREGFPVVKCGNTYSWWHFLGEFGPVLIDAAHHANYGGREWTQPNAANLHAADIFTYHARRKERWPDLVFRGHSHRSGDSHDAHPVRYVALPCWQAKTGYGHKKFAAKLPDFGGVIVTIDNGPAEVRRHLYYPERGPIWRAA